MPPIPTAWQTHALRIQTWFTQAQSLSPDTATPEQRHCIHDILEALNQGTLRVAEPTEHGWQTHAWIKQAILLYFRLHDNHIEHDGLQHYQDKVPLRHHHAHNVSPHTRLVPPATVRWGSYLAPHTVIMPAYINIGAYVGEGSMIDTWATVGSCAQIGAHVHISGGAGIGGVLEPLQANPTIIEDHCFVGARSEVAEGVIVESGSVIGMGVFLGQSTKIYHRERDEILHGRVPAGSVVVPGSLPSSQGRCHLQCAVIVKTVDAKTREKVGINELLRDAHA